MGSESFSWIIEGLVGGMSRPGMIMDVAEDIAHLRDSCNIGCVVSLTERPLGAEVGPATGVEVHHLPVPDFTPPSLDTINRVVDVVQAARRQNQAVAIHCAAGLGRTGTLLACVLVREGYKPVEAIQHVRNLRPGSVETAEQEQAVYDYAAYLETQPRKDTP